MQNYITVVIENKKGEAILVISEYEGKKIPFVYKKINKRWRPVRADMGLWGKPWIDEANIKLMRRQAAATFIDYRKKDKPTAEDEEPLTGFNFGAEKYRLDILRRYKARVLVNGELAIYKWEGEAEIPQYYPDIDSAIRAQNHILENYLEAAGSEIIHVNNMLENITSAHIILLRWKHVDMLEVNEIEKNIEKIAEELKRCRNIFKTAAFEQLIKVPGIKDCLGRINPGAMAARTAKAGSEIENRVKEIQGIVVFVAARREVLRFEKIQIEANLLRASLYLKAAINSYDQYFYAKKSASFNLGRILFFLQSAWINPYQKKAQDASWLILQAREYLGLRKLNEDNIKDIRIRLRAALKILE